MTILSAGSTVMPISKITRALLAIHAAFMVLAIVILGPSSFIKWDGVALTVALDFLIIATLWKPNQRTIVILLCTAWFMLFFMLPRLTAFLVFPASTIGFVAVAPFTPEEISRSLLYIIIGYAALWAGCEFGGRLVPSTDREPKQRALSLWGISTFLLMGLLASAFVTYGLGISVYSVDPEKWGSRLGWLTRVFDMDAGLVLLLTWLVLNPRRTRTENIVAVVLLAVWLLFILSVGSRGGPLRIMLFMGMAAFVIYGDFLITPRRLIGILALTVVASGLMYAPASILRLQAASGDAALKNFSEHWTRSGPIQDDLDKVWPTRRAWVTSPLVYTPARRVSPIITRLGLIDYTIIAVSRTAEKAVVDEYLTSTHALKNFANNMVPGELFPGSDIMTSRVFTMAFRGAPESHVRTAFLSEPWTLWGFSWIVGGGIISGTLIIFAMSAAVQAGYRVVRRFTGQSFSPYATTAFVIMAVVSGLLQLFGLDHMLTITAHFAISMTAGFLIAATIDRVFSLVRPQGLTA